MCNQKKSCKVTFYTLSKLSLLIVIVTLTACLHAPDEIASPSPDAAWMQEVIDYKTNIESTHPDSIESILSISNTIRQELFSRFNTNSNHHATALKLATWLLSEDGHRMQYDVDANLNPIDAFKQGKGNCLSFTLLFSTLAAELGINIQFNVVDIPNVWGSTEASDFILYRHINGVLRTANRRQIFDLALEIYDFGYPQQIVSHEHALSQLHSNRAIAKLEEGDYPKALHLIKLAISLSPENEDLWVNLGAILNRFGDPTRAVQAFLYAYSLNSKSEVAASRLERFYRANNQPERARKYQAVALKARENNPYYLYEMAKALYKEGNYKKAQSRIKNAISLHADDSRFYELHSRIALQLNKYDLALKDILIAYQLSHTAEDQNRYANKAKLISNVASKQQSRSGQNQQQLQNELLRSF